MVEAFKIGMKGDELHTKLGGGIPRNALVLIEAPNGVGKSILSQRFTYGAIVNNHAVSYISSELSLIAFMNQMTSLNYDIKMPLITKQLKFVSLFPALANVNFKPNLMQNLLSSREIFDSNIIIIDTLSELLMKDHMDLDESFNLLSFFKKIVTQDKTIIFSIDPGAPESKFISLLRSVSDVYLRMEEREQYGNKIKVLKVERFSGATEEVEQEIAFNVKAGIGIVVELASQS